MRVIKLATFFSFFIIQFFSAYAACENCDFNNDGFIDIKDKTILERALGAGIADPDWREDCDLNNDGYIDFSDLEILNKEIGTEIGTSGAVSSLKSKEDFGGIYIKTSCLKKTPLLQLNEKILKELNGNYYSAELLIDEEGKVLETKVSKSTGIKKVDNYLASELMKWLYAPIILNESPVKAWIYEKVEFKKNDDKVIPLIDTK